MIHRPDLGPVRDARSHSTRQCRVLGRECTPCHRGVGKGVHKFVGMQSWGGGSDGVWRFAKIFPSPTLLSATGRPQETKLMTTGLDDVYLLSVSTEPPKQISPPSPQLFQTRFNVNTLLPDPLIPAPPKNPTPPHTKKRKHDRNTSGVCCSVCISSSQAPQNFLHQL